MEEKESGRVRRTERSPAARGRSVGRNRPTDGRLLDAARDVFAERGFQRATMKAIADRADSTKPTLYAHFGDKDALYRATVEREADTLRTWVTTAYESATALPVEQQVNVYVMALFNYATAHPAGFRMLFDSHLSGDATVIRAGLVETITQRVADQIRRYLDRHDRPGVSADLLAAMMVGLVGRAAEQTLHDDHLDPLTAGELATRFILAALRGLDPDLLDAIDDRRP
ncbi:TetR/AcrR family transcriptional regulator [Actinoallomurus acanthiterrae]